MEKETLEKIQGEISSLTKRLNSLYKKRDAIKAADYDYEGKYLYHEDYGYICVLSQYVDDGCLVLQGLTFTYNLGPYRDDFYYKVDGLQNWKIPVNSYFRDKVKEITKEEFIEDFNAMLNELKKKVPKRLL